MYLKKNFFYFIMVFTYCVFREKGINCKKELKRQAVLYNNTRSH